MAEGQSLFAKRRAKLTGHTIEEAPAPKKQKTEEAAAEPRGRSTAGIWVNRAPVLVLWTAVVAERQGHSWESGITFGRQVAGLCAAAKGKRIGVYQAKEGAGEEKEGPAGKGQDEVGVERVSVLGMQVRAVREEGELRALLDGKPGNARVAQGYLDRMFKGRLADARCVLQDLAATYVPEELEEVGFGMYEAFRPTIPDGTKGWGKPGLLDLEALVKQTEERRKQQQDEGKTAHCSKAEEEERN